ncbi:hypothetical protein ACNKHM_26385 [Shigella sonnei]
MRVDLNRPMKEISKLSQYPILHAYRLTARLSSVVICSRQTEERMDNGEGLPQYIKDHPIY